MIVVRRAGERTLDARRGNGFGALKTFNEDHLRPGAGVPRQAQHDASIITYVREGALAYEDSMGRGGVLQAGEFQHMTAGRGLWLELNSASRVEGAHVFQLWLRRPAAGHVPQNEHKRFSIAERRGAFCPIASHDARGGSLRLQDDAAVYSAILEPGQHVVHELLDGRRAWLHLVDGEVLIDGRVLETGDGAAVSDDRAVSLTARDDSEILLVDVGGTGRRA